MVQNPLVVVALTSEQIISERLDMQREAPLSENYLLFGSDSSEETDDDQSQGDDLSQDHPEDPEETENLNDDDCLTGVARQTEQIINSPEFSDASQELSSTSTQASVVARDVGTQTELDRVQFSLRFNTNPLDANNGGAYKNYSSPK